MADPISQRKADHLDLCSQADVGFRHKATLLEQVELLHNALPELAVEQVDLSTMLLGKTLRAPIVIAAMTGGIERAARINHELASVAEQRGYGFGLGSQRPMLERGPHESYLVRDTAPSCLLLGNLSGVQASKLPTQTVAELGSVVGADAMCIHLNPAMELVQASGDRDFQGVLGTLVRLHAELPMAVVAKETGCGLGWPTAIRLAQAGIRHVDVSGAGGTSWVAVEGARAEPAKQRLAALLRDWGIPTAASVAYAARTEPRFATVIATGGIRSGLDIARALALGAHAVGIARPMLQALFSGGRKALLQLCAELEAELRAVMVLVGARTIGELARAPRVLGAELDGWLRAQPSAAGAR